ncbi:hypothetical protein EIP86_010886 [Pleurotus ostreatoroseus]|nr:hypothetical protein EIP86_010886 [Pleurotus ostreatoroseus]
MLDANSLNARTSAACQKAHWPTHKAMCLHRREQQQRFRDLDNKAPQGSSSSESSSPRILPSELHAELRSFTKKFNPAIFQAAFNCLHLATHPLTAKDLVVLVMLDRLPASERPPNAKPWSRFKLKFVGPVPATFIAEKVGQGEKFLEMREEQERQHLASGYLGTITVCINAACTGGPVIHNVTCMGFGDYSKQALKIEDNWQATFDKTIEKMCGRPTEEDVESSETNAESTETSETSALVRA